MILDSTHRRWFAGSILASVVVFIVFFYLDARTPMGVTGGTTAGLWFGVIATLMMMFVGSLCIHRYLPVRRWIGPRKTWLRAHIWLGLLSLVFVLCHSGFRLGSVMGIVLWVLLAVITFSGIFGLVLQQWLPSYISRLPVEASFEQLPHLCKVLRGRSDDLFAGIGVAVSDTGRHNERAQIRYDSRIRPSYAVPLPRRSAFRSEGQVRAEFARFRKDLNLPLGIDAFERADHNIQQLRAKLDAGAKDTVAMLDKVRTGLPRLFDLSDTDGLHQALKVAFADLRTAALAAGDADTAAVVAKLCAGRWVDGMEELAQERAGYFAQERAHLWLHGWMMVHVPLSAALLILVIAHVVMSLYY